MRNNFFRFFTEFTLCRSLINLISIILQYISLFGVGSLTLYQVSVSEQMALRIAERCLKTDFIPQLNSKFETRMHLWVHRCTYMHQKINGVLPFPIPKLCSKFEANRIRIAARIVWKPECTFWCTCATPVHQVRSCIKINRLLAISILLEIYSEIDCIPGC